MNTFLSASVRLFNKYTDNPMNSLTNPTNAQIHWMKLIPLILDTSSIGELLVLLTLQYILLASLDVTQCWKEQWNIKKWMNMLFKRFLFIFNTQKEKIKKRKTASFISTDLYKKIHNVKTSALNTLYLLIQYQI